MDINDLTIGQAKELASIFGGTPASKSSINASPFKVGKAYMWRTVTHIHVGVVTEIHGDLISTKNACWVADTGLFTKFISTGEVSEVEVFCGASGVNAGALIDWAEWDNDLILERK